MFHAGKPEARNSGFTLTELAIVLVIVALLIGGMLVPLSAQRDLQSSIETQKQLSDIKEALLGFAAAKGRLPCPANPALASGTVGAGSEYNSNLTGCDTSLVGALPWATLGLPETDAWGRRLTYRVTASFAKTVSSGNSAFLLSTDGDLSILSTSGGNSIATQIPAIAVSHGKNGFRAYLPSGSRLGASPDIDEEENANGDTAFVSKTQTPTFDDLVDWLSPSILKNRMISAGKLP
ncbi:MAG: type II secretion system protein [Betaproteobacteria bacterium]